MVDVIGFGTLAGGLLGSSLGARFADAKMWQGLLSGLAGVAGVFILSILVPVHGFGVSYGFYVGPMIIVGGALGLTFRQVGYVVAGSLLLGFVLGFLVGVLLHFL